MKSFEEKISVIIPSYNRANVLRKSIESVVNQTNPNWELIIVDDGSDDETEIIVTDFLGDKRIKYFRQANQGVSSARNNGAKFATGEYFIFLDSDDEFFSNMIQSIYEFKYYEYDLICWEVLKKIDEKTSVWKPVDLGKLFNDIKATFLAGSICYKKSIFEKVGGYDIKMSYGENYELGLRISQLPDLKIRNINFPLLKYTINTATRTSNSLQNRLNSHLHQYIKHQKLYEKDILAEAKMIYIIAYVLEKSGNFEEALKWYKCSWKLFPFNVKPMLRFIFLKISK